MFDLDRVDDLDTAGVLARVVDRRAAQIESEVELFALAAHYADLNGECHRDADGRVLPGTETQKQLGGLGTPRVNEFAAAEFGAVQAMHPIAAEHLIADALDCRHRLPLLWARVLAGQVRVWQARKIAGETHGLGYDRARWVDGQIDGYATAVPFGRLIRLVEAKVIEADPDAAEARREAAEADRFVRTGRSNAYGLSLILAKVAAGDAIWFTATCDRVAHILAAFGDTSPLEVRRSTAVGYLAVPGRVEALYADYETALAEGTLPQGERSDGDRDGSGSGEDSGGDSGGGEPGEGGSPVGERDLHPAHNDADDPCPARAGTGTVTGALSGDPAAFTKPVRIDPQKLLPPATLYIHLSWEAFTRATTGATSPGGVARMEDVGPITPAQARAFLRHTNVTVKPVLDPTGQPPADSYEIPDRLREALHLRTPADIFPYATNTSRRTDLDHTIAYRDPDNGGPPGQTGLDNLGPMTRHHHRIKTHGRWSLRQPRPGTYLWRTPHGYHFLVDPTGTHRLDQQTGHAHWRRAQFHATHRANQQPSSTLEHAFGRDVLATA